MEEQDGWRQFYDAYMYTVELQGLYCQHICIFPNSNKIHHSFVAKKNISPRPGLVRMCKTSTTHFQTTAVQLHVETVETCFLQGCRKTSFKALHMPVTCFLPARARERKYYTCWKHASCTFTGKLFPTKCTP